MRTRRHDGHDDAVSSLVEFALVLPLLSMLLFGIVQFGLAYDMKQSINSAAREGARMAAIPDEANVNYSTIHSRVDAELRRHAVRRGRLGQGRGGPGQRGTPC